MKSNSKNRSSMEPKAGSMKRTIKLINLKPEQSKLKDKNANYHTFLRPLKRRKYFSKSFHESSRP